MSDFKQVQAAYKEAKRAFAAARREAYRRRQQGLPAQPVPLQQASANLTTARTNFEAFADPKAVLANLTDQIPVLLMPLRIQTRFLTTKHIARNCPPELLVDVNRLNPIQRTQVIGLLRNLGPKADPLAGISSQAPLLSNLTNSLAAGIINSLNSGFGFPASGGPAKRWEKIDDTVELLIRVFPDDIFLQTHERALTENEEKAGRAFWQTMLNASKEQKLNAWEQLQGAFPPTRAAWIARVSRPTNFPDGPLPAGQTLQFPTIDRKADPWTLPPQTELLPERFVTRMVFKNGTSREVVGASVPDFLQLGFDPAEPDDAAFAPTGNRLELPAAIRWLTDFDEAVKIGMAFRVPITSAELKAGVGQLFVLGVKAGADPTEGARLMTDLLENHQFKTNGLAFLPQGTPTNNLPGQPSGFNADGLPAAITFATEFPEKPNTDTLSDGQRLASALGLPTELFSRTLHHERHEGEEALLINRALWPGTMGYFLDQLLRPAVTDADISTTKSFFQRFVTGRGLLPPFRVGKQPYGIVPITSWISWKPDATASDDEKRLLTFLKKMDGQWQELVSQVKTVKKVFEQNAVAGKEEELKRGFTQLMAYQASSTRFFRRLIVGEYLAWNLNNNIDPAGPKLGTRTDPVAYQRILEGSNGWGRPLPKKPRMLGKFLENDPYKLTDFLFDDLAETNDVSAEGENYLIRLLNATVDQLRDWSATDMQGIVSSSSKLMVYLARFALLQDWIRAATALLKSENALISPFARLDFEFDFLTSDKKLTPDHLELLEGMINSNFETRENKWAFLDEKLASGLTVRATIEKKLQGTLPPGDPAKPLQETRAALQQLAAIPDERLERLMTEHIDLCSFRLDAWLQGLVLERLAKQRAKPTGKTGVFVGAYAYLENLMASADSWVAIKEVAQPKVVEANTLSRDRVVMPVYDFRPFSPAQQEAVRKFMFVYLGSDPATQIVESSQQRTLMQIRAAGPAPESGFMLTPSLEHATTAAILRAGYEHHAKGQGPESRTLAVSLDSVRTGRAIDVLKGIQAGHSLNEQLGYFIERKLNDSPFFPLVRFVREAFPLHVEGQEWDEGGQLQKDDKPNNLSLVLDGLALVQERRKTTTPNKWQKLITERFQIQQARLAFFSIVEQAEQLFDAVSDLMLAEGIYQTVKGKPERAAAALRTMSEGIVSTLPEITQIPAEGIGLSHRMGFVLKPANTDATAWPTAGQPLSVAAQLSPTLNRWLADQLPAPDRIFASVVSESGASAKISLATLGLQAIDFVTFLHKTGGKPENSLLAFFITRAGRRVLNSSRSELLAIDFSRTADYRPNEFSIRELLSLVSCLGRLLEKSRPMRPEDWLLPSEASASAMGPLDNAALLQAATQVANPAPGGPVSVYVAKLQLAIQGLRDNFPFGISIAPAEAAFDNLLGLVPQAWLMGLWDALPVSSAECTGENANLLLDQAERIVQTLQTRLNRATALLTAVPPTGTNSGAQFEQLVGLARLFLGEQFMILPRFKLSNIAQVQGTLNDPTLLANAGEFGVDEWVQGLAVVREGPRQYQMLCNLREAIPSPAATQTLKIGQLPFVTGGVNRWVGARFPDGFVPPPEVVSLAYEYSGGFAPNQLVSGLLVDEWREKVPLPDVTAGVSIKYNQPNSEAPQTLLLVVSPEQTGNWQFDTLLGAVIEAIDLARKRLVDMDILQTTWLNQFLPAVVAPVDPKNNTPTLDFQVAGPRIRPTLVFNPGSPGIPPGPVILG